MERVTCCERNHLLLITVDAPPQPACQAGTWLQLDASAHPLCRRTPLPLAPPASLGPHPQPPAASQRALPLPRTHFPVADPHCYHSTHTRDGSADVVRITEHLTPPPLPCSYLGGWQGGFSTFSFSREGTSSSQISSPLLPPEVPGWPLFLLPELPSCPLVPEVPSYPLRFPLKCMRPWRPCSRNTQPVRSMTTVC